MLSYGVPSTSLSQAETYKAAVVEFAPKSYLIGNLITEFTRKEVAQQNMKPNYNLGYT